MRHGPWRDLARRAVGPLDLVEPHVPLALRDDLVGRALALRRWPLLGLPRLALRGLRCALGCGLGLRLGSSLALLEDGPVRSGVVDAILRVDR
eukprot:8050202-Alexandrium_andersonii.AAC.1